MQGLICMMDGKDSSEITPGVTLWHWLIGGGHCWVFLLDSFLQVSVTLIGFKCNWM